MWQGFPSLPLWKYVKRPSSPLCPMSCRAADSKFDTIYVTAALSESYTHLSELSEALSAHVTDSSSSPKDTSKPIPSRVTHRSIHRLRATGLWAPALRLRVKQREGKDTKPDSGEKDACRMTQRSWGSERRWKICTAQQSREPGLRRRGWVGWDCIQTFSVMLSKSGSSFNICVSQKTRPGRRD